MISSQDKKMSELFDLNGKYYAGIFCYYENILKRRRIMFMNFIPLSLWLQKFSLQNL